MDRVFQMMLSLKNLVQNTVLGVFEEELGWVEGRAGETRLVWCQGQVAWASVVVG